MVDAAFVAKGGKLLRVALAHEGNEFGQPGLEMLGLVAQDGIVGEAGGILG